MEKNLDLHPTRIIFVDLMRAFAVIMMVQGHTVDSLLDVSFRDFNTLGFSIWHTFRGFTAPIFMFTSGCIFTYLLRFHNKPFDSNPRIKKGIRRFLMLVCIGYLLRFPTNLSLNFTNVGEKGWKIFFAFDALHLIGCGLLFIIIFSYLQDKFRINEYIIFLFGAFFFFFLYPLVDSINWIEYFSLPITSILHRGYGSLFPLFPWVGYLLMGAILGAYLANNPKAPKSIKFAFSLLAIGIVAVIIFNVINKFYPSNEVTWYKQLNIILYRVGIVILLNGIMCILSIKLTNIPRLIKETAKHTLSIYVVHLIILYGFFYWPGLNYFFGRSTSVEWTIVIAIGMLISMLTMVEVIIKYNKRSKHKLVE